MGLITLDHLNEYNLKIEESLNGKNEDPTPVLMLEKYRVRLIPSSKLPIIDNFTCFQMICSSSENVILIDSPISTKNIETSVEDANYPVKMEQEDDYENGKENMFGGSPLETSFLTLEKLRKKSAGDEEEIVGLTIETSNFECNPISLQESVRIQNMLRKSIKDAFSEELFKLPIFVSCFFNNIPCVVWRFFGKSNKSTTLTGTTRILGHLDSQKVEQLKMINNGIQGKNCSRINRCRAIYDVMRRYKSENREMPGEVIVDMRWNAGEILDPLSKPTNSSECFIRIDLGWKDTRFYPDSDIFEEMFFVLNLVEVLTNPENEVQFLTSFQLKDLVTEMNTLIKNSSDNDNVFSGEQGNSEITEQVWQILRKCSNIKDVTDLLKTFLQALDYGTVKSLVHDDNKSLLAQLIKSSKSGSFRMPRLERLNTIEIMLEIGVESIRRRLTAKFANLLYFPEEEVGMVLRKCEEEMKSTQGAVEATAIALLPVAMSLATVCRIIALLNEVNNASVPEITRKVLSKYTNNMLSSLKTGQSNLTYTYETMLPFTRLNPSIVNLKRPRVWTCETTTMNGGRLISKTMTCLQLEIPLEHVASLVNASRPIRKINENDKLSTEDSNTDYTVSHTAITYHNFV